MIPPDDYPGGWEAGVGAYLTGQFERDLRHQIASYRHGLDGLNAEAEARHGQPFAALNPDAQTDVLSHIERGEVKAAWVTDPAAFFAMLLRHSMEGFYGDPRNCGNLGGVSWQMIGFEVRG